MLFRSLLFIIAIETFEVPLLMGTRAGVRVYTTEIFYDTSRTPIDWGLAATYAMALLVVAVVLAALYVLAALIFPERF